MKKFATMIAMVALFVLLAVSASALQINSATVGGENQDRLKNVSQTFTVTNNDTTSVTVTLASTADAKYNVRFEPATFTLAAGAPQSVKVIADIPLDFAAVEPSASASDFLKAKAIAIGEIQGKIGSTVAATSTLSLQAANQLEIKKARMECGEKTQSLNDEDRIKNLKPDTKCTIEVEVENRFSNNDQEDSNGADLKVGDIDFDTVDIDVKSTSNRDLDVNEDDNLDGLGADDTDSVTLSFDIDEDVDEGTYTLDVFAKGRDDNGATHGEHWTIKLEVNRLSHDVQIRSSSISPTRISACDASQVRVTANILNMGKRDEDDVAVQLDVPDAKFTKKVDGIELDQDDSTSLNFVFDVPAKAKAGIYRATLNTFFDNTAPSNSQALEFTVEKCDEEQQNVTTVIQPVQSGQTGTSTQTGSQQTTPTATTGAVAVPRARVSSTGSFTESAGYLWLLGGVGVVMLVIIISLLMVAFRKPRQDIM